jgi:hypothetical protein
MHQAQPYQVRVAQVNLHDEGTRDVAAPANPKGRRAVALAATAS